MAIQLRCLLVVVSIMVFLYLMHKIRNAKLKIEDSIYWIFLSGIFLLLSLFPNTAVYFAKWLGIESTVNLVYLVIIFLLLIILFLQSIRISEMEYKIRNFVQEVAIKNLENRKEVLEKSEGSKMEPTKV